MSRPLVSIITPCFNGAHCIHRLFDSIIAQTYRPIEFILVNDGSTDDTLKIVKEYNHKFAEAGIRFICHTQENKGLAGAINSGLKLLTGEYFCWPDADDYLEATSIEDRLNAFNEHPDVAVVSSDAYCRKSTDLEHYTKLIAQHMKHKKEPNQFELMLNGESLFCPGCHMVKTSCFLEVNPERHIYDCRRGQNWQLLLPLYYKYNRFFLDKPLYNYIDFPDSMSKDKQTNEAFQRRYTEHMELIIATLRQIEAIQHVDMTHYIIHTEDRFMKLLMEAAIRFNDKKLFHDVYGEKKNRIGVDFRDYVLLCRNKSSLFKYVYSSLRSLLRKH